MVLFEDLDNALDDSQESDEFRRRVDQIKRRFTLLEEPSKPIENFDGFKEDLERTKYVNLLNADLAGREPAITPRSVPSATIETSLPPVVLQTSSRSDVAGPS